MKVLIKYNFIFDPAETWQSNDSFNTTFAKYLEALGLEGEFIETKEETEKYVLIRKAPLAPAQEKVEPTVQQQKAKLTAKRDPSGKYTK